MNIKDYQNLDQAEQALKNRGFSEEFIFDGQQLLHADTKVYYPSQDLAIVEYHRFMDTNDPENHTMVFALESKEGLKGRIRLNYAADEDLRLIKLLDKIKIKTHPSYN